MKLIPQTLSFLSFKKFNSSMRIKGKKGLQKILSFLPKSYLFSFKNCKTADSIKCVRFLYFIPSANLSTSLIRFVGKRIVTVVVSRFDMIKSIMQLNINTCKQLLYFVIQLNTRGCGYGSY